MMNEKELMEFIDQNKSFDDFTGGIDEHQIQGVQRELKVVLPNSYQWFLKNYGSGGIFGVDVLGVAKSNIHSVVIETERFRKLGLDESLIVIENIGEYVYCLKTDRMENGECPVVVWDREVGIDRTEEANNFYDFLLKRLIDAKKAWEEEI